MSEQRHLGIIQSRGLGDIVIALPIARHYADQGQKISWPICEEFLPSFKDTVTWVNWIPIKTDLQGQYFYERPMAELINEGCDEIICLYQSLNIVPELSDYPWFQIQHFDEFKYTKAEVPFLKKWTLADCIARNPEREQALRDRLVTNEHYVVAHLEGSNFKSELNVEDFVPEGWQLIRIEEGHTDCIFDWLGIIEAAESVICVDSVFANLIDQLQLSVDKYWIPRSHIHLTPVLGTAWTILDAPKGSMAAQKIFGSHK